jgi:hypothetical protein
MSTSHTALYLLVALILLALGVVIPFLILMQELESTYLLNFLAFASSVAGLFLGIFTVMLHTREHRRKD